MKILAWIIFLIGFLLTVLFGLTALILGILLIIELAKQIPFIRLFFLLLSLPFIFGFIYFIDWAYKWAKEEVQK